MKIQEVVDRILAYHPQIADRSDGCDGFKSGNPQDECTGIVTSVAPSVEVIRKTAELGANLLIVHEPAFYTHLDKTDWLENNEVYLEKRELLNKHGIAIFRDHDHIHAHKPDGIAEGVMRELGWQDYLTEGKDPSKPRFFTLPKTTVRELALFLKDKIGLNGVRVIGNIDAEVSTVAFAGHIYLPLPEERATILANDEDIDVLIPGELIDWTTASYMRDAGQLGKHKAILHLGHMNMEELGMKWAVQWIGELTCHQVPVTFVRSADMYQYVL
jgi:putative NIF3 family GTP cyclohydrolase 1 type 2